MINVFITNNMTYTPFKGFDAIDFPYFEKHKICFVKAPNEAQVIISQRVKQLKPYIYRYGSTKKYLIWTLEPRFNTETKSVKSLYLRLVKIHIMNIYTGDVFVDRLSFHAKKIDKNLDLIGEHFQIRNRTLVGLMSFYKGLESEPVWFNAIDVDLIKPRVEIAFYGYSRGVMDVYGRGWPQGMSKEDSRDGDWVSSKYGLLEPYQFNLCFENTAALRYTTEKIWDSIANYCLPVYYAQGTSVYDLFPENSFIDYSLIKSPEKLFSIIQNMSDQEYIVRMNKCINVYNKVSSLSINEKNDLRKKSLSKIVEKIESLV
jgi:hypothetical protein